LEAGRLDWEQAWNELTPVEMAAWEGFAEVQPFGPGRDDLRMQGMCAGLIRALAAHEITESDSREIFKDLNYMSHQRAKPQPVQAPTDLMAETKANVVAAMRALGGV
jgi:hypothetical protein